MSAATPTSASSHSSSQRDVNDSTKFQCSHCGKTFLRRENLSRHLKTHDTIKPHKCSVCQKQFSRSDLRQRHESTHSSGIHRQRSKPSRLSVVSADEFGTSATSTNPLGRQSDEDGGQHPQPRGTAGCSTVGIDGFIGREVEVVPEQSLSNLPPTFYPHHGMPTIQPPSMLPNQFELPYAHTAEESSIMNDAGYLQNHQGQDFSLMSSWFNDDFYSALQETGTEWENSAGIDSASFLSTAAYHPLFREPFLNSTLQPHLKEHAVGGVADSTMTGRVSRLSSPPNEASAEDQVAFAWNPRAHQILTAKPIILQHDHQLLQDHDMRYDITGDCYEKVKVFLRQSRFYRTEAQDLVMPELWVANMFIGLFFRHFEPQMPVIHRATLESASQLPEYLVAIMLVIGAIYSGVKHTRRFAIVLLDLTRMSLNQNIELDNSLMREPMAIYAAALICYTGLWCGNKRAFELAEVLRGSVITYCRRNHFAASGPIEKTDQRPTLTQEWNRWVSQELSKRLCWVVYILDCQFPSLIYLPSTISLAELARIECPCDEEFWQASSARKWKRLLGPASVPPSKTFASAVASFSGLVDSAFDARMPAIPDASPWSKSVSQDDLSQPKSLNSWTRLLVLMTIHVAIFQLSQQLLLAQDATNEESDSEDDHSAKLTIRNSDITPDNRKWDDGNGGGYRESTSQEKSRGHSMSEDRHISDIFRTLSTRKARLRETLILFEETYLQFPPADSSLFASSKYFKQSTEVMHRLGGILLEVSVSDLQDSLGKSGGERIRIAMSNISRWVDQDPGQAEKTVVDAVQLISSLTPGHDPHTAKVRSQDTGPWETISFFLCTVIVWSFVSVAKQDAKMALLERLRVNRVVRDGSFFPTIERTLMGVDINSDSRPSSSREPRASVTPTANSGRDARQIFRSGAEFLTRFGTWGASLNLALLLHNRAKM